MDENSKNIKVPFIKKIKGGGAKHGIVPIDPSLPLVSLLPLQGKYQERQIA